MLTQLKRLFGWRSQPSRRHKAAAVSAASRTGFGPSPARSAVPQPAPAAPTPAARPAAPAAAFNDEDVSIPLQSVLDALPLELKCHVVLMDVRGATLTVGLHKVLPQLPQGPVRLVFGEIRRAAPTLFSMGEEFDQREVDLPLRELLSRINPALFQPIQSQSAGLSTDALDSSFNQPAARPPAKTVPESSARPTRTIAARPARGPVRVPLPTKSEETTWVRAGAPMSALAVEAEMLPEPFAAVALAPQPDETPTATSSIEPSMSVPLASVAQNWPPLIRAEIEQLDCANAHVALPESLVQAGMKQGKVAFPWRALRGWINPPPSPVVSKHDNATLELPLEVLMPLFLTRWKQTPKTQPKLVVDESIPALFAPAAAVETPVVQEGSSSNAGAATAGATASSPKTPGTDFKNRYISPTEVVTRATTLSGVAGALVVLPEGLLVASKLSGGQDPDALAAFLAQAMSRITQFAKEAAVGELSHLEFWANNVHWLAFRLNGIYFVSFGWAGGELPTTELAAMAAALDRKRND